VSPDHLGHLAADAEAFAQVLQRADLDAPVGACPGWALRELALHLGQVHLWVTAIVRTGELQPEPTAQVPDAELAAWYAACAQGLLDVLTGDPHRPTWTFAGPGTVAFWRRRQAQETAVHRVDAQRAVGAEQPVADALAADGVDEVVDVMHPRQVRLGRSPAATAGVQLVVPGGPQWLLGAAPAQATVTGSASDLLLLLWRRRSRTDPCLVVEGDLDALDGLLAQRLTP
jgi:uncharacterized protein (TIGR03083 family)